MKICLFIYLLSKYLIFKLVLNNINLNDIVSITLFLLFKIITFYNIYIPNEDDQCLGDYLLNDVKYVDIIIHLNVIIALKLHI